MKGGKIKRKTKTPRQLWIKTLDKLASEVTYRRANGVCERCSRPAKSCHHTFSRRYISTRWNPDNLLNLCYPCHIHFFHSRIEEARDWLIQRMGEAKYQKLKIQALGRHKGKPDYKLIRLDLENENHLTKKGSHYFLGENGQLLAIGETPKQAKFNLMERKG